MICFDCQSAVILQGELAVLLCVVENAKAQAIRLHFILMAFQDVFYDIDSIVAYRHGFSNKVRSISFRHLFVAFRQMHRICQPFSSTGSPAPADDKLAFHRININS